MRLKSLAFLLFAAPCFGQPIPLRERVLILVNDRVRESVDIGRYYAELRNMGFRKLSARPRHHAQDVEATADFKKASVISWTKSPHKRRAANR